MTCGRRRRHRQDVQARNFADVDQRKAKSRQRWDRAVKEFLDRVKRSRKIGADDRPDGEAWIDRNEFEKSRFSEEQIIGILREAGGRGPIKAVSATHNISARIPLSGSPQSAKMLSCPVRSEGPREHNEKLLGS
jgi:hypothetical protein